MSLARRRSLAVGSAVALSIGLASCSLLVDTSNLAMNAPDGGNGADGRSEPGTDGSTPSSDDEGGIDGGSPIDGADSGICQGNYRYCNSFEHESSIGDWVTKNNSIATIDRTIVRRGTGSLHLKIDEPGSKGIIAYNGPAEVPVHVFIRTYVRFGTPAGGFLERGQSDYSDMVQVYVGGDAWFHIQDYAAHDKANDGVMVVKDRWYCVEMEIDPANRAARAWFDGVGPHEITLASTYTPPLDHLGMVVTPETAEMWFDEFAFDDDRIGCAAQ